MNPSRITSGLLCLGLTLAAQNVTTGEKSYFRVKEIGEKLKCQCSCNYTVGSCNMISCHFKTPVDDMVRAELAAGTGEDAILAKLKAKYGTVILASPPAEGFNLVGWIMPFAALAVGLLVVRSLLLRWRRPRLAPAVSAPLVEKFRDQMEKDLADLE